MTAPKSIFLIVESGIASTLTTSVLTDASKWWPTNIWVGFFVRLTGGANDGQVKQVTANTLNTLTLDSVLQVTPESPLDTAYEIFNGIPGAVPRAGTALASLALTAATRTSDTLINGLARGLHLRVVIADYSGTPTFTPSLQVLSADGSTWVTIWSAAAGLTANGTYLYLIYPAAIAGSGSQYTAISGIGLVSGSFRVVLTYAAGGVDPSATTLADYHLIP